MTGGGEVAQPSGAEGIVLIVISRQPSLVFA
jgi:hypothetical protein